MYWGVPLCRYFRSCAIQYHAGQTTPATVRSTTGMRSTVHGDLFAECNCISPGVLGGPLVLGGRVIRLAVAPQPAKPGGQAATAG